MLHAVVAQPSHPTFLPSPVDGLFLPKKLWVTVLNRAVLDRTVTPLTPKLGRRLRSPPLAVPLSTRQYSHYGPPRSAPGPNDLIQKLVSLCFLHAGIVSKTRATSAQDAKSLVSWVRAMSHTGFEPMSTCRCWLGEKHPEKAPASTKLRTIWRKLGGF